MDIAVISDTHLAARAPEFAANAHAALAWAAGADLVVHLGDASADGAKAADDLAFASGLLRRARPGMLVLPGNHDVGETPAAARATREPAADADRLARYGAAFGPDRWVRGAAGWWLVGLDSQLLGLGGAEEEAQFDWLAATLAETNGPVGLFLHKPLFQDGWDEPAAHPRYVPPAARLRLRAMLAGRDLRFVVSGHVHQRRRRRVDGVEHLWAPATAFLIPDRLQEAIGEKRLGAMRLVLERDSFRAEHADVPGMAPHDLLDFSAVYPGVADL